MKNLITKNILRLFLVFLLFSSANANSVFNEIKLQTLKLFLAELNVPATELQIDYKYVTKDLSAFNNCAISVFSQNSKIHPGSQVVWAKATRNGRLIKKIPVNIHVYVNKKVLVANSRIKRGTTLQKRNFKMEKRSLGRDWDQYFFSYAEIEG